MAALMKRARRVYRQKRVIFSARDERALASVYRHKQEGEPGTALPAGFPSLAALAAAFYTTDLDIDGADNEELMEEAGLTSQQADAVLAALIPLLP